MKSDFIIAKDKIVTTLQDEEMSHLSPLGTINKKMFLKEIDVISPSLSSIPH